MAIPLAVKSVAAAVFAAGVALTSAFAFGRMLQRTAARESRQQLVAETWFEVGTPTSPALIAGGRKLFLDSCAHCHGADARGDEGPDLHDLQVSDRYIANTITRGIPHEMPSFAKKHGAADLSALTAYVRSLK
ncbi:MAG: fixP-2 [Lacunisphaera sp.]|jgi:mono/diheme cytochrome c family protein|nr:fixP-2 [Lacunisphaera sp.]MDB6165316.1 fixP-2 [Lacunisphaera sp.]